jgi:virginiamycin B lyase
MACKGHRMKQLLLVVLGCAALVMTPAGAADFAAVPGARTPSGKISEWPLPTPKFALDVAVAPDGGIYIAIMSGNRLARFDPASQTFKEWELPAETKPHAIMFDGQGRIWLTGNGNGTLNLFDPASGSVTPFKTPSGAGGPHTLAAGESGDIWFTGQSGNYLARFERTPDGKTGRITEYKLPGQPQGLVVDKRGMVWVCRYGIDKLGKLDPKTGKLSELNLGAGARPRNVAMAPDGTLWVTLYGRGALAHVDPVSSKVLREYLLPAGPHAGPYSVAIDAGGKVWVNEIESDSVVRVDPADGTMRVFNLPSKDVGIRSAAIDAQGRYWYVGSHNGRLGVIE